MKILITGTAGFIGFHATNKFLEKGHSVIGIDNINDYYDVNLKFARLENAGISQSQIEYNKVVQSTLYKDYRFIKLNLEDRENLEAIFKAEKIDAVLNLAAQAGVRYSIQNPYSYIQSNIVGFLNILECCRHYSIKHLVYASSSSVYGKNAKIPFSEDDRVDNPVSLYAATKKADELMAFTYTNLYGFNTTGLRFFTVYGPWGRPDMAPMLFANAIIKGEPIKVFNNGNLSRDFTFIDDIVEGVVRVVETEPSESANAKVYNIGCGHPMQLMDFIHTLETAIGKKAEMNFLPMQQGDVYQTYADTTKLENDFGYKPKTLLKDGIERFVEWYKEFYK